MEIYESTHSGELIDSIITAASTPDTDEDVEAVWNNIINNN
jgi:hypothetical protein